MLIAKSILYFVLAGLCEIGGGYLVWLWLREGKEHLASRCGRDCPGSLRSYSDAATCKLRTGICCLRRRLRRSFNLMGLESR